MRIKKLLTSILVLTVIMLVVFSSNITKTEEISEEKVYCNATIDDLTDGYKDKIEQQLNGTYEGNNPVTLETFNRILKLTLPINSKKNVLDVIDILEDRNDIISVEPVYLIKAESLVSTEVDYY